MEINEKYMRRALQLAALGNGSVSPNPMVGAVIVADGKIIGEGFHRRYGGPHAEVNAVNSVVDCDLPLLENSTLYVTLEPCSHYGKTPPCSRLIIEKHIPRVVVGCVDPFKKVSGRGVEMLREAGCEVVTGVLEEECRCLNAKFMTAHTLHRPYVLLKWAESSDRYMGLRRNDCDAPVRFSTPSTTVLVHKLRSEYDAIMVGTNTVIVDNPSLTVRKWSGRNPVRVTVDRHGVIPSGSRIFSSEAQTVVFVGAGAVASECRITVPEDADSLDFICNRLYGMGVTSLLVEGGAALLQAFIDRGLWDEVRVERSKAVLGGGVPAPVLSYGMFDGIETVDGNLIARIKRRE